MFILADFTPNYELLTIHVQYRGFTFKLNIINFD